jgi:hypothetical protein
MGNQQHSVTATKIAEPIPEEQIILPPNNDDESEKNDIKENTKFSKFVKVRTSFF